MSRRGNKVQISCWVCNTCRRQTGQTYLNKLNNSKLMRQRFCSVCRKHTEQVTRAEKSGSLGLARNK